MRLFLMITGFFLFLTGFSQVDPDALIQGVAEEMELVDNYRADVVIKIDVDFIRIKERKAVVYYEKPDKYDIKVKGLVLMPKKGARMEYLDLINQAHTAIYTGEDTLLDQGTHMVKVIPLSDSSEIILGKIWIGKEDRLIHQMHAYTKSNGSYLLKIFYANHPLNLPDKIKISFEMKGNKIPLTMTGDITEITEGAKAEEISQGVVWLSYSNYIVNYLNK